MILITANPRKFVAILRFVRVKATLGGWVMVVKLKSELCGVQWRRQSRWRCRDGRPELLREGSGK